MDHENTVTAYSTAEPLSKLGRGHSLVEPQGPVWVPRKSIRIFKYCRNFSQCVHALDFHPQLAVGATGGT